MCLDLVGRPRIGALDMKRFLIPMVGTAVVAGGIASAILFRVNGADAFTLSKATTPVPGYSTAIATRLEVSFGENPEVWVVMESPDGRESSLVVRTFDDQVVCQLSGDAARSMASDCSGISVNAFTNYVNARASNADTIFKLAGIAQ